MVYRQAFFVARVRLLQQPVTRISEGATLLPSPHRDNRTSSTIASIEAAFIPYRHASFVDVSESMQTTLQPTLRGMSGQRHDQATGVRLDDDHVTGVASWYWRDALWREWLARVVRLGCPTNRRSQLPVPMLRSVLKARLSISAASIRGRMGFTHYSCIGVASPDLSENRHSFA